MTGALILLALLVAVGLVLWLTRKPDTPPGASSPGSGNAADAAAEEVCCGMHITCESDSLLAAVSPTIEYYDDEELDAYRGRAEESYTPAETEQFRDVLLTLLPHDIAGWARSLQLRGITLPAAVRDELLLIVSEARAAQTAKR